MQENHLRSAIKGASWRVIGTIDTIFLSYIYTGYIGKALKIGGVELFTKIFLFYLHERIWMQMTFGTEQVRRGNEVVVQDKHWRSVVKGASWRAVGSLDTFWIALFINSDAPHATQTAFYIAATEVVTKIALFWLHERIWMKIRWGSKPEQVLPV